MMPRRKPKLIGLRRPVKRSMKGAKRAPLTPWVAHPFKRPRTA